MVYSLLRITLGLAFVLVHQPRLLILDEPNNGVDPVFRKEFWGILCATQKEGMTILLSTAYLDESEKCGQIILMLNSHVLDQAAPSAFHADFSSLEQAMTHRIEAAYRMLSGDHFGI